MQTRDVLPNRLGELANAHGKKLSDIAEHVGVHERTVYRWREGIVPISDDRKVLLADYFGVTVAHLMLWDEPCEKAAA